MVNYIDIKLRNVTDTVDLLGYFDIDIDTDGDVKKEDGFDTNLIMSLFCEKRATANEVVIPNMRRGWWGNTLSDSPNFEIGSKLWFLEQSRLTTDVVNLANQYALDGLRWLKDDGFLYDMKVITTPTYSSGSPKLEIKVDLIRKDNTVEYKYFTIWEGTGK